MAENIGSLNAAKSIFTPANGKQDHGTIEMDSFDVEGLLFEGELEEKEEIEKQREYLSKLSFREMESLTSLCDSFLPSIRCSSNETIDNDSVAEFFATSASMAGTPQLVRIFSPTLKFVYKISTKMHYIIIFSLKYK